MSTRSDRLEHRERRTRTNYTPHVRERQPSRPKVVHLTLATDTSPHDLIAAVPSKHLQIISVHILQESSDGDHLVELYFGNASSITSGTSPPSPGDEALEILSVPDSGQVTKTFDRNDPANIGNRGEELSYRFRSAPATTMLAIVRYRERDRRTD